MRDCEEMLVLKNNTLRPKSPNKSAKNGIDNSVNKNEEFSESKPILKLNSTLKPTNNKKENITMDLTDCNIIQYDKNDSNKNYRKDRFNNEIKKKGKHKITWIDKISKGKNVSVFSIEKIENFKNYINNPHSFNPTPVEIKKPEPEQEKTVKCKCIIF